MMRDRTGTRWTTGMTRSAMAWVGTVALSLIFVADAVAQQGRGRSIAGSATAYDGDSLILNGNTLVHLDGINAPEIGQRCFDRRNERYECGDRAKRTLNGLVAGQQVDCLVRAEDLLKRVVVTCDVAGIDAGAFMISRGFAMARGQKGADYAPLEQQARQQRRGLWQGQFIDPHAWRNGGFAVQEGYQGRIEYGGSWGGAGRCLIKGNIDASGRRSYYMPWETWYYKTQVTPVREERWFCSEDEARRAGFRKTPVRTINEGQ